MMDTYFHTLDSFQCFRSPDDFENVHGSIFENNLDSLPGSDDGVTESNTMRATFSHLSVSQKDATAILKEPDTTNPENQHIRNDLINVKPNKNDALTVALTTEERSKNKNKTFQPFKDKPFKCEQCDKRFNWKNSLKSHSLVHTNEMPTKSIKCELCDQTFNRKVRHTIHMRTHTGDKPFECEHCDKQFSQKNNLKAHMRIHTREFPFKCDQCNEKFNWKSSLKSHMFSHTGDKPFKCNQCDKKFYHKIRLAEHMRIHTGELPFKCEQCDKKFNSKSSLKRHMRIHTGAIFPINASNLIKP